jgi:hypothetical protein
LPLLLAKNMACKLLAFALKGFFRGCAGLSYFGDDVEDSLDSDYVGANREWKRKWPWWHYDLDGGESVVGCSQLLIDEAGSFDRGV